MTIYLFNSMFDLKDTNLVDWLMLGVLALTFLGLCLYTYYTRGVLKEAGKTRRDAIDRQTEKIESYIKIMVSAPGMREYFGITAINKGHVPIHLQAFGWQGKNASIALFNTASMSDQQLPYTLHPGERIVLLTEYETTITNLAEHAYEYCNSDPSEIGGLLDSNLNTFICRLDDTICKKVSDVMDSEIDAIKNRIRKRKERQKDYEKRTE